MSPAFISYTQTQIIITMTNGQVFTYPIATAPSVIEADLVANGAISLVTGLVGPTPFSLTWTQVINNTRPPATAVGG